MPVSSWSTNAADNATTLGIDIGEMCAPGNLNNSDREIMAQVKAKFDEVDAAIIAAGTLDPTLTALAGVSTAADKLIYATGADTFSTTTLTAFARTLLDDADLATLLATLGFAISGNASSGHADIPFGAATLRVNWGSASVNSNTSTTASLHGAFSTAYVVAGSAWSTDTAAGDNWYVGNLSTTNVGLTNGTNASMTFNFIALGLK